MHKYKQNEKIRNIAIIAHVDHGKTTLVDEMLKQSGVFRQNQEVDERLMDSMDLEKERGITIAAKNCSIVWNDVKINIIDTPGHADFGGEVERALSMVDGAILLVDAAEGPLPQTRFVLMKALQGNLPIILIINKIDRSDARPAEVLNEVYDLLIDLDADEEQLEFPVIYAIGRDGIARKELDDESNDLHVLLDAIVEEIPAPRYDEGASFQMLVSDLSYSEYLGRLVIGKVFNGEVKANDSMVCLGIDGEAKSLRIAKLQVYNGNSVIVSEKVEAGDIAVIAGIDKVEIGDTICTKESPKALKRIKVDEPTVSMNFGLNNSPFAGREGTLVQASKIKERLIKETLLNVAISVIDSDERDSFIVQGRGEFQLAILIETMRREGFELSVGRPKVIFKKEKGEILEPVENVSVDCDEAFMGIVIEKLSSRKGGMTNMVNHGSGRVRIDFSIPSRGLIGYRDEFLTDTKGTGMLHSILTGYEEFKGEFYTRVNGSIVCDRPGNAVAYAIYNLEPRGVIFVVPGDLVYEGMVVGEHNRTEEILVNPTKQKKLSNMRASGKDDTVTLTPVVLMTLERALQFIRDDELVEVTPKSIRIRKRILKFEERKASRVIKKKA